MMHKIGKQKGNNIRKISLFLALTTLLLTASAAFFACTDEKPKPPINTEGSDMQETATEKIDIETDAPTPDRGAKIYIEKNKFMVAGNEWWCNGVNTPWQGWNDFEGRMDEDFWDRTFKLLADSNVNCTRIWISCAGTGVVRLTEDGNVLSVNKAHWKDLEKLFAIASKHKVYVMATFLSFDHFKNEQPDHELWRKLIKNDEYCQAYAEKYVKEFCRRFGEEEYLFSIDLMNEPDWVFENAECGKISWDRLSYFFGVCASAVHETCSTPVTVGLGMPKYNSAKHEGNMISDSRLKKLTGLDGATIDFYSPHYYPWERQWYSSPYEKKVSAYGLDTKKPCMLGEVSGGDDGIKGFTLPWGYEQAYKNGFAGIMVWGQPTNGWWVGFETTAEATNHMYELIPEKIKPIKTAE